MNYTKAFISRLRKTCLIYLPFNFFFVISLIIITSKIYTPDVPDSFILKLIARNLIIILPWALFFSNTLYSHFDAIPLNKPIADNEEDIELGPLPSHRPTSKLRASKGKAPAKITPHQSVVNDLGEGPSSRPYGIEQTAFSEFVDIDLGEGPSSRPYGIVDASSSEFVDIDLNM